MRLRVFFTRSAGALSSGVDLFDAGGVMTRFPKGRLLLLKYAEDYAV